MLVCLAQGRGKWVEGSLRVRISGYLAICDTAGCDMDGKRNIELLKIMKKRRFMAMLAAEPALLIVLK